MGEVTKVGLVNDETKKMIRALSAYRLPINPSGRGMSATEIKDAFYKPIIDGSSNIIAEINRIVGDINSIIGNMDTLAITADDLVGAINKNKTAIDKNKTDIDANRELIDANGDLIEQANAKIGDIDALATEAESLVGAINELLQKWNELVQASEGMAADIGNVEELLTEAKTLVGAINENKRTSDQNATAIGNVTEVTIGSNGNLVDSINSLKYYHDVLQGDVRGILARLAAAAHNYVLRDFLEFVSYCKDEHDELSPGDLYTGDNVLIVEENVPDFWFEETSDESLVETYTYEGVEYPLAARHGNGELFGVFHILESDYTVIEGYSSIASENAEAAVQAKKAAEESANAAEASASAAEEAEEAAEASEEAAEKYSREAKEAWNEVKEYKSHFANALVGHARGNPVVISDLSPHSHTVECVAERKNLFPNFITDQTYTNGSFVKVNADGSITVHKVAGEHISIYIKRYIEAGTYTLSNGLQSGSLVYFQVGDANTRSFNSKTVTYNSGEYVFYLYSEANTELAEDVTLYPQLEKGTTATSYAPYIESVEGLEVKAYGKNLLSDAVYDTDNWVRDEGISINSTNSKVYYLDEIPNGTYTISAKAKSNYVYLYFFYSVDNGATWQGYRGANGTFYIIAGINSYSITFEKTEGTRFLIWHNNINYAEDVDYIQIEAGATATAYEPYKAPVSYITDANGYAELLSSTDDMTVVTDSRAVLDVTYQRDINALNTALDLNAVDERISAVNAENDAKLAEIRQGIGRIDARMSRAERFLGIDEAGFLVIDVTGETVSLPQNAHRYAQLLELHGDYTKYTIDDESSELYHHEELFLNYPQKLVGDNGTVLLEITDEMAKELPDFGLVEGNYIYFLDGRAIYHREYALGEYYVNTPPVEGAEWVRGIAYNDYGLWILPQATETDVTHVLNFDGVLDIEGINSIQIFMKHSEEEIDAMNGPGEEYSWSIGKTKFAFELL